MKILSGLFFSSVMFAQTSALMPVPIQSPLDNNGHTIVGACMYSYASGTSTPLATYSNAGLGIANTNPMVVDANGRLPPIYLSPVAYKIVFAQRFAGSCPATPGTVMWSRDPVFDAGQVAMSALTAEIALLASSAGSSHVGFIQSGTGAVAETAQAKMRQTVSVMDYGATCDGATDDRISGQAAIDATGGGTLNLCPAGSMAVSAPGIFLYPANDGITVNGLKSASIGGLIGGFKATPASPPPAVLTIYAEHATLNNVTLDCNNYAATNGIVSAMGYANVWTGVGAHNCSGDGALVNLNATTGTNITAGGGSGSSAVTVASVTNNRLTFGSSASHCSAASFDFGLANPEVIGLSSVVGNVLNLSSPTTHTHTTARCHGNSNTMQIRGYIGVLNLGWGWNVLQDSDANGFYFENPRLEVNTLGGAQWHGSAHVSVAGQYAANGGPAIQLGTSSDKGSSGTAAMVIGAPGDIEGNGTDAIVSVCDNQSSFNYVAESTFVLSGSPCAGRAGGSATIGYGISDSTPGPCFSVKTAVDHVTGDVFKYGPGCDSTFTGMLYEAKVPNVAIECTGVGTPDPSCPGASANNALVATLRDKQGNLMTISQNLEITISPLAHTLQAGANSLNLNNFGPEAIVSRQNPANPIATAYAIGGDITVRIVGSPWLEQ